MAQVLGLGFFVAGVVVTAVIVVIAVAWRIGLHSVLSFWIIYVLTRPLGASIGDYLSQPSTEGGLGWGATLTSVVFFVAIIGAVIYLAVTKSDVIETGAGTDVQPDAKTEAFAVMEPERGGVWQSV